MPSFSPNSTHLSLLLTSHLGVRRVRNELNVDIVRLWIALEQLTSLGQRRVLERHGLDGEQLVANVQCATPAEGVSA